jgi:hypothetical protein
LVPLLAWGQPCGGGREKIGPSGELEWLILEERVGKRAKRIYGLMQYRVDEAICERAKVYRVETVSVAVRASAFESERVLLLKAGWWGIDQFENQFNDRGDPQSNPSRQLFYIPPTPSIVRRPRPVYR